MLRIELSHGRDDPNQDMEDWGYGGPTFDLLHQVVLQVGPLESLICRDFQGRKVTTITTFEDMVMHEGKYYGDFTVDAGTSQRKGGRSPLLFITGVTPEGLHICHGPYTEAIATYFCTVRAFHPLDDKETWFSFVGSEQCYVLKGCSYKSLIFTQHCPTEAFTQKSRNYRKL